MSFDIFIHGAIGMFCGFVVTLVLAMTYWGSDE